MSRYRTSDRSDSLVKERVSREQQFRLFAVEPHGWSTFMLEDRQGQIYLGSVKTGTLTPVRHEDAEQMLDTRAYRQWNGDRAWASLDRLPLIAWAFTGNVPPADGAGAETAF